MSLINEILHGNYSPRRRLAAAAAACHWSAVVLPRPAAHRAGQPGSRPDELRVLQLQRLDGTAAPAVGDGLRERVGEDVFLVLLHPVEDTAGDGLGR